MILNSRFLNGLLLLTLLASLVGCDSSALTTSDPDFANGVQEVEPAATMPQVSTPKDFTQEKDTTTAAYTVPEISNPRFCRLAIGPNRERTLMAVVSVEDQKLFIDLNNNTNFADPDEALILSEQTKIGETRFWSATIPEIKQGEDVHTNFEFKFSKKGSEEKVFAVFVLNMWGVERSATDSHLVPLPLSSDASGCPLVHFNGPLTMCNYRNNEKLKKGSKSNFYTFVGTVGEGQGTNTPIANSEIPADAHPVAVFTFPNQDPNEPPIVVKSIIETRC